MRQLALDTFLAAPVIFCNLLTILVQLALHLLPHTIGNTAWTHWGWTRRQLAHMRACYEVCQRT